MLEEGIAAGMLFISDADARPPGCLRIRLRICGTTEAIQYRRYVTRWRCGALGFRIRAENIPVGMPLSLLEARLLPLYLHHRYQLQAAVKSVGGVYYTYAVKTASGASPGKVQEIVSPVRQRDALTAVLENDQRSMHWPFRPGFSS